MHGVKDRDRLARVVLMTILKSVTDKYQTGEYKMYAVKAFGFSCFSTAASIFIAISMVV